MLHVSRRGLLGGAAALALGRPAIAQGTPIKIGLMLPFSGTFAVLGENIAAAFELCLQERGGKLGGNAVTLVRLDDEFDPAKAPQNVNRLLERDQVQVLIGTVHSGCRDGTGAGGARTRGAADHPERRQCRGHARALRAVDFPFVVQQLAAGLRHGQGAGGERREEGRLGHLGLRRRQGVRRGFPRRVARGRWRTDLGARPALPRTNFQPILAQLPGLGVEAVGSFFAGGGAVQFVKDYAAAGLREKLPLCGSGFLTEGVLKPQGAAAEGIQTALHYGDGLDNARNTAFRAAFKQKTGRDADVYAVQGYDAGQMLAVGLEATKGDATAVKPMAAAIRAAKIDSPRGAFTLSPSHNPVQTIYLREAKGGENRVIGVAADALADPGTGCKMSA